MPDAEFEAILTRAAEDLSRLPEGSAVAELLADDAVMRQQARACRYSTDSLQSGQAQRRHQQNRRAAGEIGMDGRATVMDGSAPYANGRHGIVGERYSITDEQCRPCQILHDQDQEKHTRHHVDQKADDHCPCPEGVTEWQFTAPKCDKIRHRPILGAVAGLCHFPVSVGYQTNTLVYSAGGYRFLDFVRIGVPMNILIGAVTVLVIPLIWPLAG
ncbi:hypothetical protein L1965_15840 [Paracoccus sp. EGI L200073]|nr:hypothetical protein [Paracoccus salsus]